MKTNICKDTEIGTIFSGFVLLKKEYVVSKVAMLYTMKHEKTGAELLYFDRAEENKTFAICFKTLPEDSTGVFHILEHSVLNGSEKYPVKEPFVSMLQNSMQTFLNAMTFGDKTVYPVSSRNDKDFFNLMSVYLDAVFCPAIYEKPEIFMQEGWHYEFENSEAEPYYNGVVFNEMKGVYANADSIIEEELGGLLFPDTSSRFSSGGDPEHITDLTYEQFIATHKRFYHPTNSKIFLDGHMDIDAVLAYIDGEYLSKYDYRAPDFDFVKQIPTVAEKSVVYAADGNNDLAHMAIAKILCDYNDVETIYAASVLADYLTGSNEAPLKRAFLEKGIAQDAILGISDGIYQPTLSFTLKNMEPSKFEEAKALLVDTVKAVLARGLNKKALRSSLERFSFDSKQIKQPYGVILAINALGSWLYGDDPLLYIENERIFVALKEKLEGDYFEKLLREMLADPTDKSCLYVLPSTTKAEDDAQKEHARLLHDIAPWSEEDRANAFAAFTKMSEWQMSMDDEAALLSLPRLSLDDIPDKASTVDKAMSTVVGRKVLHVQSNTNGIVYLDLYFDASSFTLEELKMAEVAMDCLGDLCTKHYATEDLQNEIRAKLGEFSAKTEIMAKPGDIENCTPYFVISTSMLEENVAEALRLVEEILLNTKFDESDRIREMLVQRDYMNKQSLISGGHVFAVKKSLSASSKSGALKEQLEGESFVNWFSAFTEGFAENATETIGSFKELLAEAFAKNHAFVAYSGNMEESDLAKLLEALPTVDAEPAELILDREEADSAIEIPANVGFSAMGHNLYALGAEYTGACTVLSSLMTFSYLWNMVRVQGGAYGTGMSIAKSGDIFCYSFRDPNLENTKNVISNMADFLIGLVGQGLPLNDIIIGAVNSDDPLLDPSAMCSFEARRYLCGIDEEWVAKLRKETLHTTEQDLLNLAEVLKKYAENGKFCGVGNKNAIAFIG